MIHVEGKILDEDLTFDVKSQEKCHQVRKALQFFELDESKSSCSECPGCPVLDNSGVI